jgi:hypothetical protein
MDLHGDTSSSEGNKWVEQSTLFGSCLTWMRTLPAIAPDEPDDFSSAAGTASLTVKVGGTPLAKAGAAIVSFYTDAGGITVVGSGLIDSSGVVNAVVSGDPTHCHIHGQNLIPTSFELAARPEGRVSLDGAAYACGATVSVRVADSNIPGSSPSTIDTTSVELGAGAGAHTVELTEVAADRSIYIGTAVLGSDLIVAHGDALTATYIDVDDGAGGSNIPRTAGATIDCLGPVVGDLGVSGLGANEVTVSWTTDEPGTSWARINPGGVVVTGDQLTKSHELVFDDLDPCTTYTISVASTDALGNAGSSAETAPFTTWMQSVAFADDVEAGPGGWVVDTVQDPGADPNWGIVTDPATSSPTHSWFTSDEGDVKDDRLEAGPFSLGGGSPMLSFWHHFETEAGYDGGVLEVSTDGSSWQDVEAAGGVFLAGGYNDDVSSWSSNPLAGRDFWAGTGPLEQVVVDLTPFAGSDLWIRFRLGCDGSVSDEGWWVDDIEIETTAPCDGLFIDGFESGDCGRWATVVGEN